MLGSATYHAMPAVQQSVLTVGSQVPVTYSARWGIQSVKLKTYIIDLELVVINLNVNYIIS